MNGANALVTVAKTDDGGIKLTAVALGSKRKVTLILDADEGMTLADEIHRNCWVRPEHWGKAPEVVT
jgi:hypothetical protein